MLLLHTDDICSLIFFSLSFSRFYAFYYKEWGKKSATLLKKIPFFSLSETFPPSQLLKNRSGKFLLHVTSGLSSYATYHRTERETGRILSCGEISRLNKTSIL